MAWSGASVPARSHTRARTAARAALIAANAAGASTASVSISRDTVGSEATCPNTAGLGPDLGDIGQAVPTDRDRDRQIQQHLPRVVHGQRPHPRAATPRTVPGPDRPWPAVAASSTAPAWETTRFAVVSTISDG